MRTGCLDPAAPPEIRSLLRIAVEGHHRPWSFGRHRHDDFLELSLITRGGAYFECDQGLYRLKPGDLAVKNAGALHSERSLQGQDYEQLCLCLSGAFVPGLGPNSLIPQGGSPVIRTGRAFEYLRASFRYLFELAAAQFRPPEAMTEVLEKALAVILSLAQAEGPRVKARQYSPMVAQAVDYLNRRFYEPLNLEALARALYVSPSYLSHKFKEEVGVALSRYLASRKLGEAQMQLVFGDGPIKEIAAGCGYSTLQHFYPEFKKHTGTTPRLFRDYHRRAAVADAAGPIERPKEKTKRSQGPALKPVPGSFCADATCPFGPERTGRCGPLRRWRCRSYRRRWGRAC